MSQKITEKNLKRVLLNDGAFSQELFEYELEEHLGEYLLSKQADSDKYFFAVTEHTNDVAMILIDENDNIHINEAARGLLMKLWHKSYRQNIQGLIPRIAEQLDAGYLFAAGVKIK